DRLALSGYGFSTIYHNGSYAGGISIYVTDATEGDPIVIHMEGTEDDNGGDNPSGTFCLVDGTAVHGVDYGDIASSGGRAAATVFTRAIRVMTFTFRLTMTGYVPAHGPFTYICKQTTLSNPMRW